MEGRLVAASKIRRLGSAPYRPCRLNRVVSRKVRTKTAVAMIVAMMVLVSSEAGFAAEGSDSKSAVKAPVPDKAQRGASLEDKEWRIPADKEKFHIFLLMGQSNMAGGLKPRHKGYLLEEDKIPVPHVLMIPQQKNMTKYFWKPAAHPLHLRGGQGCGFGLGLPFAKRYLAENPGVTVGLVPLASGGKNIGRLNKGSKIYEEGMKRAGFAARQGVIKGVLWHQGESDRGPQGSLAYEGKLHGMIADLRKDLQIPNLPFVVGDLGGFTKPTPEGIARVRAVLRSLPEKVPHTGFVESAGLKRSDRAHFDRPSYVELGHRYCDEIVRVIRELESDKGGAE